MAETKVAPKSTVALLGSQKIARHFERSGWAVRAIDEPAALNELHEGDTPRLIVVADGRASATRIGRLVNQLRAAAPLVDVIAWRPDATGAFVRAALRAGATDVVLDEAPEGLIAAAVEAVERQNLLPQVEEISRARNRSGRFEGMLSRSDAMWDLFMTVSRTASSDATVLITGETGTGKDLLARAIHRRSGREGRFVAVNCSSIRPEIVESELFGYERGAFTGASHPKQGLFRHADGGTLLLDEIGDMPAAAQLSLLRVLQEGRVRPVGSSREIPVSVRVVAATNAPLDDQIKHGTFREDLFYRLDVIRLAIPALRDRPEDVLYLFGHFLRTLCKRYGVNRPHLNQAFIDRLIEYEWPGNVRQLENVAERIVLEGDRETLTVRDLNRILPKSRPAAASAAEADPPAVLDAIAHPELTLAENVEPVKRRLERDYLEAVLREKGGRVIEAARHAGISRRTMLRKMNELGLDKRNYRPNGGR